MIWQCTLLRLLLKRFGKIRWIPHSSEKEREVFSAQARESGKPEEIIEKMIEGRIKKFLKEICVETQPFVKDPQKTVGQLVKEVSMEIGVGIRLESFIKYQF